MHQPEDVIEAIGFGRAQILTVVLSQAGFHFCDSCLMCGVGAFAKSMGAEFKLTPAERGSMTTVMFAGIFVGTSCVGVFGDTFGRRITCLCAYLVSAACSYVLMAMQSYGGLLVTCCFLGIGIGIGYPPSIALTSEMTPVRWRIPMRVFSCLSFIVGHVFVIVLLAVDDPMLHHLHWRRTFGIFGSFAVAFGLAAFALLPESPVLLARTGRHEEASRVLDWMKRVNGMPQIGIDYEMADEVQAASMPQPAVLSKLASVMTCSTFQTGFVTFCLQLTLVGAGYAAPQILEEAGTLQPTTQMFIGQITTFAFTVVVGSVAQLISRKTALMLALLGSAVVNVCFCASSTQPAPRSWFIQALFQVGSNGLGLTGQLGMVVVLQLAVELHPPIFAATSGSVVQGAGRFGAIIAAEVFEKMLSLTGSWLAFFYLLAATNILGALVLFGMVPPTNDEKDAPGYSTFSETAKA